MNGDQLRKLPLNQLMNTLKLQVDATGSSLLLGMVAASSEHRLPPGAILAIGDFLIYPRFSAEPEKTPADRQDAKTCGCGKPLEPSPDTPGRNLETAPPLGSSPAEPQ